MSSDLTAWRVLIVDDEPDSLRVAHDILTLSGAQVYQAETGAEGLALLARIIPTLIITDLAMSTPNGWDLLKAIRADVLMTHVPVVAVSAYASVHVIDEAKRAGFNSFVSKPFKLTVFLNALKEVMG